MSLLAAAVLQLYLLKDQELQRTQSQESLSLLIFSLFAHAHTPSQTLFNGPRFWFMTKNLKFLNSLDSSP